MGGGPHRSHTPQLQLYLLLLSSFPIFPSEANVMGRTRRRTTTHMEDQHHPHEHLLFLNSSTTKEHTQPACLRFESFSSPFLYWVPFPLFSSLSILHLKHQERKTQNFYATDPKEVSKNCKKGKLKKDLECTTGGSN